jgi:hypothetical protein
MTIQSTSIDQATRRPDLRLHETTRDTRRVGSSVHSRVATTVVGAVSIIIAAWGGLAPYVGHALQFNPDNSLTWTWNLRHSLLYLLPGSVAVVGGALIVTSAWVKRWRGFDPSRVLLPLGALLVGVSGMWFILGPSVWPIFYGGHVFSAVSPTRLFDLELVYNLGVGIVLTGMAAVAGTRALRALQRGIPDQG